MIRPWTGLLVAGVLLVLLADGADLAGDVGSVVAHAEAYPPADAALVGG